MPIEAPTGLLNARTVRAFNAFYYRKQKARPRHFETHYGPFFYPLDAIRDWNRLYGRPGFYQYQCVVPPAAAEGEGEEASR